MSFFHQEDETKKYNTSALGVLRLIYFAIDVKLSFYFQVNSMFGKLRHESIQWSDFKAHQIYFYLYREFSKVTKMIDSIT